MRKTVGAVLLGSLCQDIAQWCSQKQLLRGAASHLHYTESPFWGPVQAHQKLT